VNERMDDLLLTFYGDDFTGSTDVTEVMTLNGVPTVLITDARELATARERFPAARVIGLAGVSRSMTPEQMDASLPARFETLRDLGAGFLHYKVCSTFDSAPDLGSIGHAIDLGVAACGGDVVPMIVGAPNLKRYQAFGNLFATVGDETIRLDRHPTMSRHPATPMTESDLRRHLALQTGKRIDLIDLLTIERGRGQAAARLDELVRDGAEVVLLDVVNETHLEVVGDLVWSRVGNGVRFSAASSGLEYALVAHWRATGKLPPKPPPVDLGPADRIAVVSGSAAPATAAQIDWAIDHGFAGARLDAPALVDPATADDAREAAVADALAHLEGGRSVVLYSVRGPDDPALEATRERLRRLGADTRSVGERLATQQGKIMRALVERAGLRRVCVSGGDTCGHALSQLGIYALEVLCPVAPGSPICRSHAFESAFDDLEISLKAGQVGKPSYFGFILEGREPLPAT
jgi:3-oxoisoapionate kinase